MTARQEYGPIQPVQLRAIILRRLDHFLVKLSRIFATLSMSNCTLSHYNLEDEKKMPSNRRRRMARLAMVT